MRVIRVYNPRLSVVVMAWHEYYIRSGPSATRDHRDDGVDEPLDTSGRGFGGAVSVKTFSICCTNAPPDLFRMSGVRFEGRHHTLAEVGNKILSSRHDPREDSTVNRLLDQPHERFSHQAHQGGEGVSGVIVDRSELAAVFRGRRFIRFQKCIEDSQLVRPLSGRFADGCQVVVFLCDGEQDSVDERLCRTRLRYEPCGVS